MKKKETIDKATLKELVQTRIKEDYWEDSFESHHVTEAARVCKSMLDDDAQLERLLIARNYTTKAVDLFWEQVHFRARHKPALIGPESLPTSLPSGAWRLCGFTKDGHVISNYKLEFWHPDSYGDDIDDAIQEYTRYVCYMIELMLKSNGNDKHDKFSVLFDLNGFYLSMVTKANIRKMIGTLIYVAQAQYPERLERVYLVNAPYGFSTAWTLIAALLDAKTTSKIKFCTTKDLLKDIDAETLSVSYGGQHKEYPIPSKTIDQEAYQ